MEVTSELDLARALYPRVSTVLRDMSLSKPYPEIPAVEWGRARGKAVHKAIELYERGVLDVSTLHEDVAGPFQGYLAFKKETAYEPKAFEDAIYHDGLRFRGTLDSRGCFHGVGETDILDFKCSKQPDLNAAAYQLAAYAIGLRGIEEQPLASRFVIQLGDGSYRIHNVTSERAIEIFQAAVTVWHVTYGGEKL